MKTIAFAAAVALVATSLAAPADARRRHHRHHDDVDAGDVVAGVAIVGGIAAIASAIKENNREKQDAAVDVCADEAEHRGQADLAQVTRVDKKKGYYTVEGLLEGETGGTTPFTCTVRNGRIYSFSLAGQV